MKISNLIRRTLSGIAIIMIFLGALLLGKYSTFILIAVIFGISLAEVKKMFSIKGDLLYTFFLLAGISGMFLAAATMDKVIDRHWILYFVILYLSAIVILFILVKKISIKEFALLGSAQLWFSSALLSYFYLGWMVGNPGFSPLLLILLIIIIWVNDTFAYLTGNLIGKTPLARHISPGKTIEGFLGGIVFSVLATLIIAKIIEPESPYKWMIMGALIAITATIGDLFESKLKREADVKDSGKIFPGHGGMFDRFDSLFFSAPVFLILYIIL